MVDGRWKQPAVAQFLLTGIFILNWDRTGLAVRISREISDVLVNMMVPYSSKEISFEKVTRKILYRTFLGPCCFIKTIIYISITKLIFLRNLSRSFRIVQSFSIRRLL